MIPSNSPLKSKEWRLDNLYSIVNKEGQRVKFKRNNIQRLLSQHKSLRKMILKSRQVGISTHELISQLDFVLFNKNKTACILAHEQDAIEKLFRIPRRSYDFLKDDLKPKLYKGGGSKFEMFFPRNNSRIYCDLSSRGDTIHWLHISEKAFIDDIERVMATVECVPIGGIITMESTCNGLNHFYDDWMDSNSNYEKIFFPWFFHEEYILTNHELTQNKLTTDELNFIKNAKTNFNFNITLDQIAFRRFKQSELKEFFKQEYPEDDSTCFLTSGENPFALDIVKKLYEKAPEPVQIINDIKIFKRREQGHHYVIGADTSEGVDKDYSAAHVFDVMSREQVASYRGRLKPSEFADKLNELSKLYSTSFPCLLAVEANNHGHAVLLKLDEYIEYPNLFKHDRDNDRIGWRTDKITRPIMVDMFIDGVENGSVKLNCKDTLAECLTLTTNNGKIEAANGKHDDLFIAACISIQLCIEESKFAVYSNIKSKIRT